jgi:long-chain acyl-CoA synthetase
MADHGFWQYAQADPGKLALVDPSGKELSRGELLGKCNQVVQGLRAMGLEHGDCVSICSKNCAEFYIVTLACQQAGLYIAPINWHLAAPEVAYIIKDSGSKAFFGHEGAAEICIGAVQEIDFPKDACFSLGSIDGFRPFADLLEGQSSELPENRSAGATMNYTSGTTGNPKGVKRGLPPEGVAPEDIYSLYSLQWMLYGLKPEDDNVHIVGSPLYHTAVLIFSTSALHFGHAVVVMEKWTPEGMLQLIDKYKVTSSHMVPTQFHRMLQLPEEVRAQYDCSSTRAMIHAAAPCPPEIKRQMIDWWGKSIWEYYAATEGGGTIVSPDEWLQYPGTVGKAWPTAEVRIYDDEGVQLGPNEQGTVYLLLSEQIKFEYKGDEKKTKKNRIYGDDGVFFTVGDIGYLNEEGYLFLCDRKIDMIISGGANIYPAEIENVFFTHPKVGDVCVFGIPHEDWGEEIKAVIEPAEGVEPGDALTEELLEFAKTKLGKFKIPKSIDYIEKMPRDENGKLPKRKLRDPYWEGKERAI